MARTLSQTKVLNGLKGGRRSIGTKALAKQICSILAQSNQPLTRLCPQDPDWPDYDAIMRIQAEKPWFRQMLLKARERQADFWAQESQGVAHDVLREPESMAKVQAAKLVCENTRWYTGKILKRIYGDDAAVNVDARTAVVVGDEQIKELRSRLNDARALVKQSGKGDAEP